MPDVIERFCAEYHAYHDISPARRIEQRRVLDAFAEFCGGDILQATAPLMSSWLAGLSESQAATTVEKKRKMLRPFFKWAFQQGLFPAEELMAVRDVPPPRGAGPGQPRPYSRELVRSLWRDLAKQYPYCRGNLGPDKQQERAAMFLRRWTNGTSRFTRVRPLATRIQMEAIIALALYGGLRRHEILRLTPRDCDPENEYVSVVGAAKNRQGKPKERAVPWTTPHMKMLVARWLRLREALGPEHDSLWLSLWGEDFYNIPLPENRYVMLLTKLGRGWEFHRLRHTAATELLRAGYDVQIVQRIMGHASIDQTLQYAKIVSDDIISAAQRREPQLSGALAPPELMIELHGVTV